MDNIIEIIHKSLNQNELLKVKLVNPKNKELEYSQIIIKPIVLKNGPQLSFVYRYDTKDITKNYNHTKSILTIRQYIKNDFSQAIVFTTEKDVHFSIFPNGKTKIKNAQPSLNQSQNLSHDKQKTRLITQDKDYLNHLGITSTNGLVKAKMNGKYRQINKFIEIVDSFKSDILKLDKIRVADMGAGKGYLSFALCDYLHNQLNKEISFDAVELRENLVTQGNQIAKESNFSGLNFIQNDIQNYSAKEIDILIALHACDTATDDAIQKGIHTNASLIICSPCCHKQVRKDMEPNSKIIPIIKHGILKERQAEIVTDSIRALILQYFGYKTNVMEFISSEHTSKNLLITAVKDESIALKSKDTLKQIAELKSIFGVKQHQLEVLMSLDS